MALLCSVIKDVPIERKRDITCGTSCLCWWAKVNDLLHLSAQGRYTGTWCIARAQIPASNKCTKTTARPQALQKSSKLNLGVHFICMCLENKCIQILELQGSVKVFPLFPHHILSKVWIQTKGVVVLAIPSLLSFSSYSPPRWHRVTIGGNTTSPYTYSLCTSVICHIKRGKHLRISFYFLLLSNLCHDGGKLYCYLAFSKWKALTSDKLLLVRCFLFASES